MMAIALYLGAAGVCGAGIAWWLLVQHRAILTVMAEELIDQRERLAELANAVERITPSARHQTDRPN